MPDRTSRLAVSAFVLLTCFAAATFVLARTADPVTARSRGMIGYSGNPSTNGGQTCSRCHSGGAAPEVTLAGPSLVMPGTTHVYSLTVSGGQRIAAGFNVSAAGGVLAALTDAADVQLSDEEVTHTGPKNVGDTGEVVFEFEWTAPDAPGSATLYGAGNAIDRSGNTSGDGVAADTLAVTVGEGGQPTEPPGPTPTDPPTNTPPPSTPTEAATAPPPQYDTVFDDLDNPHGLSTVSIMTFLVSEGGTGEPVPGEFAPGNGDGRVQRIGPMAEDRTVIVDGMTNSQDPGGGIVGANHAIQYRMPGGTSPTAQVVLVAQAGGPAHLRPDEAAKILKVSADGTVEVLADTLAFEREHNPGGEEGPDGIDSNPWRLRPFGDRLLISDAGANDVLALDPATGELGLYAVFAPIGASQAVPTGLAASGDAVYVALLGSMFSEVPEAQVRRLEDLNDDGDALDEGENTLFIGGLMTPTEVAIGPFGNLYVLEMFPGTMARIDPSCWSAGSACDANDRTVVATGLTATTALTWDDNFDALVTTGPQNPAGPSLRTDRVVRVPFDTIRPPSTPEPTTPTATPSETPTGGTATPTPATPERTIYLPAARRG